MPERLCHTTSRIEVQTLCSPSSSEKRKKKGRPHPHQNFSFSSVSSTFHPTHHFLFYLVCTFPCGPAKITTTEKVVSCSHPLLVDDKKACPTAVTAPRWSPAAPLPGFFPPHFWNVYAAATCMSRLILVEVARQSTFSTISLHMAFTKQCCGSRRVPVEVASQYGNFRTNLKSFRQYSVYLRESRDARQQFGACTLAITPSSTRTDAQWSAAQLLRIPHNATGNIKAVELVAGP